MPKRKAKTLKTGRKPGSGRPKGSISVHNYPTCKLSQKTIDEFVDIVRRANTRQVARQRLGIPQGTYDQWMKAGRRQIREVETGKRPNLLLQGKFVLALERAEGYCHGKLVEDILDEGSVQAKMWYLEKRFGKYYRNLTAVDDETGKESAVDPVALLAEKLQSLIEK